MRHVVTDKVYGRKPRTINDLKRFTTDAFFRKWMQTKIFMTKGKSTLINAMANWVYGVKWEDDFRFNLILDEQGEEKTGKNLAYSQTKWTTAYVLHKQIGFSLPYTLTVIDTPGFGDTEDIKADEELKNQFRDFFSNSGDIGVDQLDGICFVVQASLRRLTPTQTYIFDSILSVFGNDVEDNIYILITYADAIEPPVLEAIQKADIPYKTYFKFNNSALFSDKRFEFYEMECDKMFWEKTEKSFKMFFKKFQDAKPVSLTLTKEVLNERKRLETALQGIQPQITADTRAKAKLAEILKRDFDQFEEYMKEFEQ
ncbi:unnamed protein product [Darwinula stevensoni]|uniref:AIG1-type G domain-containing protein n=1 Tax=Darwinula stevensoni TaxID=69355 RepID=A0A7R9A6I8_9CRUS|nr:unnamed protein product [Darwinula stevensoni]CAG0889326.1 unnamed protein product [Darwinula stevensoni]